MRTRLGILGILLVATVARAQGVLGSSPPGTAKPATSTAGRGATQAHDAPATPPTAGRSRMTAPSPAAASGSASPKDLKYP
jgi:hypothetical protein